VTDPEFRFDRLRGEWTLIVGDRQRRPNQPAGACPFCVGGLEAPQPYSVKAFPNRWPPLVPGEPVDAFTDAGARPSAADSHPDAFERALGRGAAEIVLYSPDHRASLGSLGVDAVREIVDVWAARTAELLARPEVASVLVFENRGAPVGATIEHPHGQIYAFPFVPPAQRREAAALASTPGGFAAVIEAEIEAAERIIFLGDGVVSWVPFASPDPYGVLIAPNVAAPDLPALDGSQRDALAAAIVDTVSRYDALFATPLPYLMWIHQAPTDTLRTGHEHVHLHFAPPWRAPQVARYYAAGEVGSGIPSNPIAPEAAAAALRAVNPEPAA
jgi:UDPglucose--hexose-1-phosphate uridylyltransferase